MHKHQHLRLMTIISGDDPNEGGSASSVEPEEKEMTEPDVNEDKDVEQDTEPTEGEDKGKLSQEALNAIIERRVSKQKAESEALRQQYEDSQRKLAELETQKKRDIEEAEQRGRTEAKREQIAKEYGVDVDLLPEDDEKLKRYKEQMDVTISNRRKILPVEVVGGNDSTMPSFIGRAHA